MTQMRSSLALLALLLSASACVRRGAREEPAPTPAIAVVPETVTVVVAPPPPVAEPAPPPPLVHTIVPAPASVQAVPDETFTVDTLSTTVTIEAGAGAEVARLAREVARMIARDTAPAVVRLAAGAAADTNTIVLRLDTAAIAHPEGYRLTSRRARVELVARTPEGLFRGIQTLRQLLPWSVEHRFALYRRLRVPGVTIEDAPRFAWRGSMLDVARHFLPVEAVKRHVDAMALYKLNRLHLHLADDQGWRIQIRSHPRLTRIGGSTQVGGGPGGFYTQAQFRELVRYAQERYVEIIPEIDMPGHTNAALASLPWLNCDGKAPPLYTGIKVGFSALCPRREATYRWVDDVVRELAAISPSPYLHLGGDEVEKIGHAEYLRFVERVQAIVRRHGKTMVGWGEIAPAKLDPNTIVQHWRGAGRDSSARHVARGGRILLSPGPHAYIDMKYDSSAVLGLRWAGMIPLRKAYEWNPGTYLSGVPEPSVIGVEAPLWSETVVRPSDFQFLAFPRLLAIAEVAWSPQSVRGWEEFRRRIAEQGPRMQALGINFYRTPEVDWVP